MKGKGKVKGYSQEEEKGLYSQVGRAMDLLPERYIWKIKMMKERKSGRNGELGIINKVYMNEIEWDIYKDWWGLTKEEQLNSILHEIGHILIDGLDTLAGSRWVTKDEVYFCSEKTATRIGMLVAKLL